MSEIFDIQQFIDKKHGGLLAANQTAQQQKIAIIADNLTRSNIPGAKEGKVHFKEYVQKTPEGERMSFMMINNIDFDQTQGGLKQTGSFTDFAINGNGYFKVETLKGNAYTRNGQFFLSSDGSLITSDGGFVLSENGDHIKIPSNKKNIHVSDKGIISADGQILSKIGVVSFENASNFKYQGNSIFTTPDAEEEFKGSVIHKALENSNVSANSQIVEMTKTQRNFESTQKMIDEMEKTTKRTVNVSPKNG